MPRYIDVDKLIAEYDRVHVGPPGGARKLMVEAPTADVVEVVRCKDCDYSCTLQMGLYSTVQMFCRLGSCLRPVSPTDFCSWAGKGKNNESD